MQITKNGAKKTSKKPKPVRVVKDSLMPTTLDKDRIREAVQEVLRARLSDTPERKNSSHGRGKSLMLQTSPASGSGQARLSIIIKQGLVMD